MISNEVASLVPRFFDGGKGPSHDELTRLFAQTGLTGADPGMRTTTGELIGKMKRVRSVLWHAVDRWPEAGSRLVKLLIDAIRAHGGFRPGGEHYAGEGVILATREAFVALGYELDLDGSLRPTTLENLEGKQLTEALWVYVRRARLGISDAPLLLGTGKDVLEAAARHVLVEAVGSYQEAANFPATLFHAFDRLGLSTPSPALLQQLDSDPHRAMHQSLYLLACTVNRLRNREGTGHGRPAPPRVKNAEAQIMVQAAGLVVQLLLEQLTKKAA